MAEPVDLDPGPYDGTYKLVGGALALDFANLVSYRGTDRQHDWLDPASNAVRWGRAAGVHVPADTDVDGLRELREVVARTFLAVADDRTPTDVDVDRLGGLAARAWTARTLRFPAGATVASWTATAPPPATEVAVSAASLLTSAGALPRVTACGGCRWLFLDTSRNRSRRWCDPADCGNRARQRRHYHRHRNR